MEDLLFEVLTQLNAGDLDHDKTGDIFKKLVMLSWYGSPVVRRVAREILRERFDTQVGP